MASTMNVIADIKQRFEETVEDGANMWTKENIEEEVHYLTDYTDEFNQTDLNWIIERVVQWAEKKYNTILND